MSDIQTNLSILNNMLLRNTSNLYTKLLSIESKKQFIDMYKLDIDNIYDKVIIKNKETKIYTKKTDGIDKTFIKQKLDDIYGIYTKDKNNGSTDLYIGYYFVDGYISKGKYIRGPLFMVSCDIKKNQGNNKKEAEYILEVSQDEPILNIMLLMEICKNNNLEFDEEFMNSIKSIKKDEEEDVIKQVFSNIGAKYYIDLIEGEESEFIKFQNYSDEDKPKLEQSEEVNKFRLSKSMVLGIFKKSKSGIYSDYIQLLKRSNDLKSLGLLKSILSSEEDKNYDYDFNHEEKEKIKTIDESEKYFLSQLDYSQEEAVLSVDHRNIVTIEGPPGTGKSEVIASIISNNIMKNKSILMVCEKDAALKVILDKYENRGLGKYITHIVDNKNLNKIKKKLCDEIREIINTPLKNLNSDINKINNEIQESIKELDEISKQLYNKEYGMSLHELYGYQVEDLEDVNFEISFQNIGFTISKLESIKSTIKIIANSRAKFKNNSMMININEKCDLDNINFSVNDIIKKYNDLNNQCELSLIQSLYKAYGDRSSIVSDIYKYEAYLNYKGTLIDKIKAKIFETFKLKNIDNNLKIHSSKLNDTDFIIDELEKRRIYIDLYESLILEIEKLKTLFNNDSIEQLKKDIYNYDKCIINLEEIKDLIEKIDHLHTIKTQKEKLDSHEKQVIDILLKNEIGISKNIEDLGEYWYKVIEKSLVKYWINFLENKFKNIKQISSDSSVYEEICQRLSNNLKLKEEIIPRCLEAEIISNVKKLGEEPIKKLENSFSKSNKKASIKDLVSKNIDNELLRCKPIWLLTPEVATSVLPLKEGLFDIIIFDEASQMALEDSIPCIYRGKKIVVSGDTNQLPPPKFNNNDLEVEEFDNVEKDENKETLLNSESLLHYMKHKYYNSKVFLNYHYRSKYKELINFSNYAFYDGNINIIPNAVYDNEDKPIEYIYLEEGRIDNSANILEAKKVVDVLKDTMIKYDDQSIAIIAFTKKQQEVIEKEINKRKDSDEQFKEYYLKNEAKEELDNRILISNIDEIQGDQRDIVMFSIGYAPRQKNDKADGSITGNLNKKDGKYRLNVAISRAKNKIIIISSIKSNMLPSSADEGEGRKLLKKYLDYCEAVYLNQEQNANEILKSVCSNQNIAASKYSDKDESPLETQIRQELTQKGVNLKQQVEQLGFRIDFAVIDPRDSNRYLLAIEADGATYHESRTAKERDLYRQRLLEGKGWTFIRIWSRDWWKNKEKEVQRVLDKIDELIK